MAKDYIADRWDIVSPLISEIFRTIESGQAPYENGCFHITKDSDARTEFFMVAGRDLFTACSQNPQDKTITFRISPADTDALLALTAKMT